MTLEQNSDNSGGHLRVQCDPNTQIGHAHRRASRINDTSQVATARRLSYAPQGHRRSSVATSSSYLAGGSSIARSSNRVHSPPGHKALNTFRLFDSNVDTFDSCLVKKALDNILKSFLEGEVYEKKRISMMTENITNVMRTKVKDMKFHRYKLICNLLITQNCGQSIRFDSRCLWAKESDNFAEATFSNQSIHAVATVHALYFE